jgi:hypothetical protein
MRTGQHLGLRVLFSALAAFSLSTLAYVVEGFLTPGDYSGNGSVWLLPADAAALVLGLLAGFHASSRLRIVLIVPALLSCCFWAFVPDGWWVHAPPLSGGR